MAARVTYTEVNAIMPEDATRTQAVIEGFIASATVFIDTLFSGVTASDELLKELERWLTAHLITVGRERLSKKEGAGGASIEYAVSVGQGLSATPYGQMAVQLDTTGTLSEAADQKKSVYFKAIERDTYTN